MTIIDWIKASRHFGKQDQVSYQDYLDLKKAWSNNSVIQKYDYQDFAYQAMSSGMSQTCSHDIAGFEGTRLDLEYRSLIAWAAESEDLMHVREIDPQDLTTPEQWQAFRAYVARKRMHLEDPLEMLSSAMNAIGSMVGFIFNGLSPGIIQSLTTENPQDDYAFSVALIDLIDDPKKIMANTGYVFEKTGLNSYGLFTREFNHYINQAYGVSKNKNPLWPDEFSGTPREALEIYFGSTWMADLFNFEIPFTIPKNKRFEHTQVIGKTGHGKTQLLQNLIMGDLYEVIKGEASIVVIDSQADMIQKIARLKIFDPELAHNISERLIIIDPTDPHKPPALNLFDFSMAGVVASASEKERLINTTIELYEYMFSSLLGADMTQKQGVLFKNLARLLTLVPKATIQTLMDFLEDDYTVKKYVPLLEGMPRRFFETQFDDPQFKETKKQILWRLHDIFGQAGFERMFINEQNAIDMYGSINSGKIILINTATDFLGDYASQIFGRFFIALLAQSVARRASLPEHKRLPTYVYIDEASEYFDDKIRTLIHKARKQKMSLTMAHQELKQLTPELANTMRTTGTKLVGKVTAPDARSLAEEMNTSKDQLQGVKKVDYKFAEYTAYVSDLTDRGIVIRVPFGLLEQEQTMSKHSFNKLLEMKKTELMGTSVNAKPTKKQNNSADDLGEPELL